MNSTPLPNRTQRELPVVKHDGFLFCFFTFRTDSWEFLLYGPEGHAGGGNLDVDALTTEPGAVFLETTAYVVPSDVRTAFRKAVCA